jgi:hypothetical protein
MPDPLARSDRGQTIVLRLERRILAYWYFMIAVAAGGGIYILYLLYHVVQEPHLPWPVLAFLLALMLAGVAVVILAAVMAVNLRWQRLVITPDGFYPPGPDADLVPWSVAEDFQHRSRTMPTGRGGRITIHSVAYRIARPPAPADPVGNPGARTSRRSFLGIDPVTLMYGRPPGLGPDYGAFDCVGRFGGLDADGLAEFLYRRRNSLVVPDP